MTNTLTIENIKEHIIHRHENILLDSVIIEDPNIFSSQCFLKLSLDDHLNRHIFLKQKKAGQYVLSVPFFMEILALSSIVATGKLKPNEAAIFAGISNFKKHADFPANKSVSGLTSQDSVKHSFFKYSGKLMLDSTLICEGKMTAFFGEIDFNATSKDPISDITILKSTEIITHKKNRYKPESMIMCDALTNSHDTGYTSSYTYPKDHPLTKGHFPGNPIMMGVMQWMTLEDSLCTYLQHKQETQSKNWSCNAIIYNQDNAIITELKHITLTSWIDVADVYDQTEIQSTKRIIFRNMVRPGDTLYTVVTDLKQL